MINRKVVIAGAFAFVGAAIVSPSSLAQTHSSAPSLKEAPAFSLLDLAKERTSHSFSSQAATTFSHLKLAQKSSNLSRSKHKSSHSVKTKKRKHRKHRKKRRSHIAAKKQAPIHLAQTTSHASHSRSALSHSKRKHRKHGKKRRSHIAVKKQAPIHLAQTTSHASHSRSALSHSVKTRRRQRRKGRLYNSRSRRFTNGTERLSHSLARTASNGSQSSQFAPARSVGTKKSRKTRKSSTSTVAQQPRQEFVMAAPVETKTVTATSDSTMQPSTSSKTPPAQLSSALGLGPKSRIHINGFLSAGIAWTDTSAKYFVPSHGTIDNHVSAAPLSLIGLQFTADLANSLQIVTQLVGDGDNTNGNVAYRVNVEWAFLRYAVNDNYQVQAGRFRLPAFMYSQTQQVGYSYPWVILPNEVYRVVPFEHVNGIMFLTRHSLGNTEWNISSQTYYGNNQNIYTIYNPAFPDGFDVNFDENAVAGIVASIGNENFIFRGTYTTLKLTANFPGIAPNIPATTLFSSNYMQYYSVGTKMSFWHILLIGEYANSKTPSNIAALEGYYASLGFKVGKLVPLFTYARIKTTNASSLAQTPNLSERPQDQQSYTLSLDYKLNSNLDVKGSISQISPLNGTFGLFNSDPERRQVYLYGLSLDAIF